MLFATAAGLVDSPAGQDALGRLAAAIVSSAASIGPEVNTTVNYANRQKWVSQVCSTPEAPFYMARTMFLAVVMTAPVVTALDGNTAITDADLATVVASLVDTFAGRT
ncbi:MAG TPA: hypothetical protein VFJ58_13390 [Armatimonadota bacterium]|nr:hypothetical protein [Armatimonadota bacterium]